MSEDSPTIGDIYQWFDRLAFLPIGEAAVLFFSKLGYLCDGEAPLVADTTPSRFVYKLLPTDRLLSDKDRTALESAESCAKIATFRSSDYGVPSVDVDVYAIDLKDCGSTRSEDAYNVHELIAKFNNHPSVVFFRCESAVMLSFLQFASEGSLSIRLSDWFSINTKDDGQIGRMHVASCSLASSFDLFDSLEFEAIRHYYKYPITRHIAIYDYVFQSINLNSLIDFSEFSRDAQDKAIQEVLDTYPDLYGDDYIVDEIVEVDRDEDIDLDDLEWEAQKIEMVDAEDDGVDERKDGSSHNEDDVLLQLPPAEVMSDPIALLEWLDSHSGDPRAMASPEVKDSDESLRRHVVPIGKNPPAIGCHVRHIRLGEGTVTGIQETLLEDNGFYVSALFGSEHRTFLFPSAFENGLVQLLA